MPTASANGSGGARPHLDRPLRVGVIGNGYWGPQIIRNFHEMPDADLVVVAERRLDRANNVRRLYPSIETVSDHHALLQADIDCVVVATPIHTHYEVARDALLAGKDVLVEKPLTGSLADAVDLMHLAEARNRVESAVFCLLLP